MDPAMFSHNASQPPCTGFDVSLLKRQLHTWHAVIIVVYILVKDNFNGRRKSLILAWFAEIINESVISGFTDLQDLS